MEKPARHSLLPGVADDAVPPRVVFRSRTIIARARRRAALRDVVDLLLLASVDGLFLRWPQAHVPALDRDNSLLLLAAMNLAMLATVWLARSLPRWSARRVAATWSSVERSRLLNWLEH
jgi:hypothetical protein